MVESRDSSIIWGLLIVPSLNVGLMAQCKTLAIEWDAIQTVGYRRPSFIRPEYDLIDGALVDAS